MLDKTIAQKLAHLSELTNDPIRKERSVLCIFHELFLMTHEGRDLPPDTLDWLNEAASLFLSPSLFNVLSKLRLTVYGFKFAALHLIDIEDVIDELSNGEILKDIHYLPPGAFNKLKRELLPAPQQYSPEHISWVEDDELISQKSSAKHHITQSVGFTTVSSKHHSNERAPKPEASTCDSDCLQNQEKCVSVGTDDAVPLTLSAVSTADVATTKIGLPSTSGMIYTTSTSTDPSPVFSFGSNDNRIKCGKPRPSTPSPFSSASKLKSGISSNLPSLSNPSSQDTEEVVYCHRAKLFCFSDGEWKEQGVGDVKILRRTSTGKTRFLMRREGDSKICLHHALTSSLSFRLKDEKSWHWAAKDFSGSEEKTETFGIRFRDAKTSKAFMAAVLENQNTGTETNGNESIKDEKSIENDQKVNAESMAELAVASKVCNSVKPRASPEPTEKSYVPTFSFSLVDPRFRFNTPTSSGNNRENERKDDAIVKPVHCSTTFHVILLWAIICFLLPFFNLI